MRRGDSSTFGLGLFTLRPTFVSLSLPRHLALFIVGVSKWEKSATTDLLNREQTEEWKGWMQFSFLMYHYFSAHETYNAIRVMITCYVWMTGFGNFSFFYIKRDFGFVILTWA